MNLKTKQQIGMSVFTGIMIALSIIATVAVITDPTAGVPREKLPVAFTFVGVGFALMVSFFLWLIWEVWPYKGD